MRLVYTGVLLSLARIAPAQAPPALPPAPGANEAWRGNELAKLLKTPVFVAGGRRAGDQLLSTNSVVTVLHRDFLDRYPFLTLTQVLRTVAGLDMVQTFNENAIPTIRGVLQDHWTNKVLVMINGVPAWHGLLGNAAIARIDLQDVERIEILRGPASVLYGSNAYAGAINLILKVPQGLGEVEGALATGSLWQYRARLGWGAKREGRFIAISSQAHSGEGRPSFVQAENNTAGFVKRATNGGNAIVQGGWGAHRFLFNTFRSQDTFLGNRPSFAGGTIGQFRTQSGNLLWYGFEPELAGGGWIKAGAFWDWSQTQIPQARDGSNLQRITGLRRGANLRGGYAFTSKAGLEGGLDFEQRISKGVDFMNPLTGVITFDGNQAGRKTWEGSAFAQLKGEAGPARILLGARTTRNELFGTQTSPRGTVVWVLDSFSSLKLIYGEAYRSPTLQELYTLVPNIIGGNDKLRPEKSKSWELAYLTARGAFSAQATAFRETFDGKIYRASQPPPAIATQLNAAPFKATGGELEFKYYPTPAFQGFLNLSHVRGDRGDEVNGNGVYNYRFVPAQKATVGLWAAFGPGAFSTVATWWSRSEGMAGPIASQWTWDLGWDWIQQRSGYALRHKAGIQNVLDRELYFAEYVRRNLNRIPYGSQREGFYQITAIF